MTLKSPYFKHFRVVEKLHSDLGDRLSRRGFSLVEVLVALVVLGITAAGIVTVAGAGRRLGEIAAVRTAQVLAVRSALGTVDTARSPATAESVAVGDRRLAVTIDTVRIAPGLLELKVWVQGFGPAGPLEAVTRRAETGP